MVCSRRQYLSRHLQWRSDRCPLRAVRAMKTLPSVSRFSRKLTSHQPGRFDCLPLHHRFTCGACVLDPISWRCLSLGDRRSRPQIWPSRRLLCWMVQSSCLDLCYLIDLRHLGQCTRLVLSHHSSQCRVASLASLRCLSRSELAGLRYCSLWQQMAAHAQLYRVILRGRRCLHLYHCGCGDAQAAL